MLYSEEDFLAEVVEFHGHVCLGSLLGLRMAVIALNELGSRRSADEELWALAETESCAVDAVQVVTGCTVGKGNLFLHDLGKQAFTVGSRLKGWAVRVSVLPQARDRMAVYRQMTPADFFRVPPEEVFFWRAEEKEGPGKARVFSTVPCARCGEMVMEPRARMSEGKIVCQACQEEYPPRWNNGRR